MESVEGLLKKASALIARQELEAEDIDYSQIIDWLATSMEQGDLLMIQKTKQIIYELLCVCTEN